MDIILKPPQPLFLTLSSAISSSTQGSFILGHLIIDISEPQEISSLRLQGHYLILYQALSNILYYPGISNSRKEPENSMLRFLLGYFEAPGNQKPNNVGI